MGHIIDDPLLPEEVSAAVESLHDELEALADYDAWIAVTSDPDLVAIMTLNRNDEVEHANRLLAWLVLNHPTVDVTDASALLVPTPVQVSAAAPPVGPRLRPSLMGKRVIAATRLARWERDVARAVQAALDRQRKHVLAALRSTYGHHAHLVASVPPDAFDLNTWSDDMGAQVTKAATGIFAEIRATTAAKFLTQPGELPEIDLTSRLDRLLGEMQGLGPDTSTAIGSTLTQGVGLGESIDKLAGRVQSVFDSSDSRATLIARTEVVGASNSLSFDFGQAIHDTGTIALQRTWLATLDERTRPDHADADGQTVEGYDTPFDVGGEELMYPGDENGSPEQVANCRAVAPGTRIAVDGLVSMSRVVAQEYLVRLVCASGQQLAASPEHPVLTTRGFVRADQISEGDDLVSRPSRQNALTDEPDERNMPPKIEELYRSLQLAAARGEGVVRSVVKFDRDGTDDHVEVVRPDHDLSFGFRAPAAKHADEIEFALTHREMGLARCSGSLLGVGESDAVGVADSSTLNASYAQTCGDDLTGMADRFGDREFAFSGAVSSHDGCVIDAGRASSALTDALPPIAVGSHKSASLEFGHEPGTADVRLLARLIDVQPGEVQLDRVLDARVEWFEGHLYDVQTRSAWFIANGIIVHNCTLITDEAGTSYGEDLHIDL